MKPAHSSQTVRAIGRNMMLLFWAVLVILLAFLFSRILEHRQNPNTDPRSGVDGTGARQVVLQRNRAGHYVGTGRINGSAVTFLLDTGATQVAVPGTVAKRLGLRRGIRQTITTANGQTLAWSTLLHEVGIGAVRLEDVQASILPSMEGEQVLLGMSFLRRLELVQRDGELTLRQPQGE